LHRQENELSSIKAKLHETQNRNLELEKEKEDRYTKMRAEVFDNSVQLIQGHQWAHEELMQRIAYLEGERDQVTVAHEAARRQISTLETDNEELAHRLEERHFLEQESHTLREMQQSAERAQSTERITHHERELDQERRQIPDTRPEVPLAGRPAHLEEVSQLERQLDAMRLRPCVYLNKTLQSAEEERLERDKLAREKMQEEALRAAAEGKVAAEAVAEAKVKVNVAAVGSAGTFECQSTLRGHYQ